MLVLSRKVGEAIRIGEEITIIVSRIEGNRVRLGVRAPRNIHIVRSELEPLPAKTQSAVFSTDTEPAVCAGPRSPR